MSTENQNDEKAEDESEERLAKSMERIQGYIREFQAKYRQLEEEQRLRKRRKSERDGK